MDFKKKGNYIISKVREYASSIGITLISSILWEYILKPYVSGYYPPFEHYNGFIVGIFIFQFFIYSKKTESLDEKLNKADRELLDLCNETIKQCEQTRKSYNVGTDEWNEITNKILYYERRRKTIEDRIRQYTL